VIPSFITKTLQVVVAIRPGRRHNTRVVRLVLFDIDGTLIHTKGAGIQAFERTFASEFHVAGGGGAIQFAGRTDPSIVREFFQRHAIEPSRENFQRFFDSYVFLLDYLLCKTEGEICVGVWNFINGLQALPQPPRLGLLTGNIRLGAEIKLRHFQFMEYFCLGAFGDDHEDRNQLAHIALERGRPVIGPDLTADQVMVVGDTPLDIACAKAVGAKSLAVATGGASYEQLAAHQPTWLCHDLREIAVDQICE
jgi:phosphoglycolate phosphatase-like HAD superfamily hydrolase